MMFGFIFLIACSLLNYSTTESIGQEEKHRVVIVGAGVSGFAAATALLAENFTDFVVLEASDRVGGRIHTVEFGGVPIDKGAEFVHGEKDNVVFELVSPHNLLASYKPLMSSDKLLYCDISGNQYNSSFIDTVVNEAWEVLSGDYDGFNGSVAEYFYPKFQSILAKHSVDSELGEALQHLIVQYEGTSSASDNLEQLGVEGGSRYVINEGDLSWKWKPGSLGYRTIFDILSKKFPSSSEELPVLERIIYGKEVLRIERFEDSGEVVLSCADGSNYRADHVIVTVSLGVLKKHAGKMFQPPLPQNKTDAIQTLGIGCVGKVFLLFPTRWWPSGINAIMPLFNRKQLDDFQKNSTHGYWTGHSSGFNPVMNHERMLCAWFSGQSCRTMETLTEQQVIDGQLELLNAVVGQQFDIPRPEAILRTNWATYNYTLGAYSLDTVESDSIHVNRHHLSDPLMMGDKPVVMFAGEATSDTSWSTVHGALATGRREANRLLQYIRTKTLKK